MGKWVRGLGLDFTHPGGTWGKWDMRLCFGCGGMGGVGGSVWSAWAMEGWSGVVLSLCAL